MHFCFLSSAYKYTIIKNCRLSDTKNENLKTGNKNRLRQINNNEI